MKQIQSIIFKGEGVPRNFSRDHSREDLTREGLASPEAKPVS